MTQSGEEASDDQWHYSYRKPKQAVIGRSASFHTFIDLPEPRS
jgi:hypothetical protein